MGDEELSLGKMKRGFRIGNLFACVGAEGFEPPTLCL